MLLDNDEDNFCGINTVSILVGLETHNISAHQNMYTNDKQFVNIKTTENNN